MIVRRVAAERAASQSTLRQLVIGVQDYADSHDGNVPPGPANWFPKKGLVANNGYGPCLFHILPFLEQDPLYKSTYKKVSDTPLMQ